MRQKKREVKIGNVTIGGSNPIAVQTMLNVPVEDIEGNVAQAKRCEAAGCQILRVTCPSPADAKCIEAVKNAVNIPIVADIHFDYKAALACADVGVDKIRINPGNIGDDDRVKAVVHLLYPGQAGGRAFAEMLSGKVVPSAKLPFTIEKRWEDSPACGNYDETRKERKVYYNEGIFVGYRGYDRKQVEPLYPFGYGLSYTSFEYSDLQLTEIDKKNKSVALSFNITNTGGYEGAEVAQVYVRDIASKEARPLKELKGFQKVFLRPGETKHVSVTLDRDAFQYFSEKKSDWVFESGEFEIWVGASSKDIRLKTKVKM